LRRDARPPLRQRQKPARRNTGGCRAESHGSAVTRLLAYYAIIRYDLDGRSKEIRAMPTRNVVLTDHQAELVDTLVRTGRYQNASEVLREGLRLVEQHAAEDAARLEALKKAAETGWNDIEAGRYADVTEEELGDFI